MSEKRKQSLQIAFGILTVVGIFIILAYAHIAIVMKEQRLSIADGFGVGMRDLLIHPFAIFPLPKDVAMGMLFILILYAGGAAMVWITQSLRHGYNKQDEALGGGKFLQNLNEYNEQFTEPFGLPQNDGKNNIILSKDIFLSMNNQKTRRNLNVFVIGGSGAGKSYNLVGPNLMQANCSFIVTDPSGGLFKEYGGFLESQGYKVKSFNLDHMENGNHYNPFRYVKDDKDIEVLVTTLISNTTPPDKKGGDPFWEKTETALLVAIIAYLHHYGKDDEKSFSTVMRYLRMAEINEDRPNETSELDAKFEEVKKLAGDDAFAYKQYRIFKMGAGRTLKSILISCAVRLQAFDLETVKNLTDQDDIDLDSVGDEKTALFIIIPTGEKTFNFLASMMYSQLFQRLYGYCENTAEFSTLIVDSDDQVVKTFRADGRLDMEKKKELAEQFLDRAKNSSIVENRKYKWYELRTNKDELVTWRYTQEDAVRALVKIRHGRVKMNSEQTNHGQRVPIHVSFLLDEFANIGKIPDFPEKVATIRKYDLSVFIILQSLAQMKNLYEKQWGELTGNCDNTIYLGGGADTDTTEWISKLLGKETRTIVNTTFSKGGGSTSLNKQGVELLSPAELRIIPEDECIVIPKSKYAFKGKKYPSDIHPNRELVKSMPTYFFDAEKTTYLTAYTKGGIGVEQGAIEEHDEKVQETEEEARQRAQENQQKELNAEAAKQNQDPSGNQIMGSPQNALSNDAEVVSCIEGKDEAEIQANICSTTDEVWDVERMEFGEAPAEESE
ncbi:MAG: type IV secretory system conjugative DNA transfer family protein [Eubacteriales bacterium]|nr:type IV secretory system conjugative DNA transfer family protein [Eubacteriales bacterium]